jgi:signal transduction histidine kinase
VKTAVSKERVAYVLLALFCLIISLLGGWSAYATRINHNFYDLYFHQRGPQPPSEEIVIVAIDDATLGRYGALPLNRSLVARAVRAIQQGRPRLIAIDLLLTDVSTPEADRDLETALLEEPHPVLSTALEARSGDRWLLPLAGFAGAGGAIGHVHADPDPDGVSRQVLLAKQAGRERYWALAFEGYRMALGDPHRPVTETDDALEVPASSNRAPARVPATRTSGRAMLINYAGSDGTFPEIGLASLLDDPSLGERLRDKFVMLGVTAQATGDRLFTPFSTGVNMPGVEIHANILHTLLRANYLQPVGDLGAALVVVAITAGTALALVWFHGTALIALLAGMGVALLGGPYWLFLHGSVWPSFSLLVPFGTTLLVCGGYQLLSARRKFADSEARRRRSQQQFEMATHEIRTPLTAIQASSELLSRYPLDEARRKQMLDLIFDESQRLGKLVERFLSVERLSAGEMELRREPVNLSSVLDGIVGRLQAAAERKRIQLVRDDTIAEAETSEVQIEGDPELVEFAVSNLVTNAVKYGPAGTSVKLALEVDGERARIHVTDSGPGMTPEESRKIFDRFYRTDSAARSDAPGFGLGLAIAREIARHHGGDLELETKPGAGSRFTIWLPARAPAGRPKQAAR